jgi:polyisoprenoid-binding protein YceI
MHQEILDSAKFPEIVFTPSSVSGSIAQQGTSQMQVSGTFRLHGQDHPMALTISVVPVASGSFQTSTQFAVPYVHWGLKNPSTFLLRVSDTVNLEVHATAQISTPH